MTSKSKLGSPEIRRMRNVLRGTAPLGAVAISRAAQMLDCPEKIVRDWLRSGRLLGIKIRGELRVPLSEIRRRRR